MFVDSATIPDNKFLELQRQYCDDRSKGNCSAVGADDSGRTVATELGVQAR